MKTINCKKIVFFILICSLGFSFTSVFAKEKVNQKNSLVMKILAVNPLKDQPQAMFLKAYLPKEATDKDIIDLDGLEVTYDQAKKSFYVYKKIELPPAGIIRKKIVLKDVWLINLAELEEIKKKTIDLYNSLTDIEHISQGNLLREKIENNIAKIIDKQTRFLNATPAKHIKAYRENKKLLTQIKADKKALMTVVINNRKLEEERIAKEAADKRMMMLILVVIILLIGSIAGAIWWMRVLHQKQQIDKQDVTYDFKYPPSSNGTGEKPAPPVGEQHPKPKENKASIEERLKSPQQPPQESESMS